MGFDNIPTLSGLFYINSTKDKQCGSIETVLSWNHFWGTNKLQQPSFTPFSYNINNVFEYLELFEVNDSTFNIQCQINTMDLKLWEKKENSFKELLNVPIKLQPFIDTFSNPKMDSQFYKEKMPVVSLTDWIDVNVGSTVEPILSAKIQVALAIGTTEQLSTFKTNRNITILATKSIVNDNPVPKKANPTALAEMLSSFIDNLALSLPKRSECDQRQQLPTDSRYQLRRTSDLLDVLHSALKNPAPGNLITSHTPLPFKLSGKGLTQAANHKQQPDKKNVRVVVSIDSVRNLTSQENTQGTHNASSKNDRHSTYVSFEAIECDSNGQYSTFATKIATNRCNPFWNEKFNVQLPGDLIKKDCEKKFILKVWRKISEQDEIIGVTSIDLSSLSSGSTISGHYNIVNNAGHVNGQLKLSIVLTDDINCKESSSSPIGDESELPNDLIDLENGSYNVDNIILSRTLKRKFTELEEISQRLKSRLLDVTADDENFDMDDEFENDLNTCPNEDEVDVNNDFDWNRFSTLEIDCGANDPLDTELKSVGPVDYLANDFNHTALNISNVDANELPADGHTSMHGKSPE